MQPLTERQKDFIYRKLVYGRLRALARPVYGLIIACELGAHRVADWGSPRDECGIRLIDELTAIVKTFERPRLARRLLASIRRHYPALSIIVVDDSRDPFEFPDVRNLHLPYNSGISAGRNEALRLVETPFVLILDDDFVFTRRTGLGSAMRIMMRRADIDIMGGQVVNLPLYVKHDYAGARLFSTGKSPVHPPGAVIEGLQVMEKVPNFFIGRTESLRKVGWNSKLKLLEHADFFSRARGVLTTVMNEELQVLHARTPFDLDYMRIRRDTRRYRAILHSIYHRPNRR